MSFWTWVAITLVLVSGIVAANSRKGKTEQKYRVALIWFIVAVILFFVWWFSR